MEDILDNSQEIKSLFKDRFKYNQENSKGTERI